MVFRTGWGTSECSCCVLQVLEPMLGVLERSDFWQIHPAVFCPSCGGGDPGGPSNERVGHAFY